MSDRLSALLQRFELHAAVLHSGALCGVASFGGNGLGHLHLVRRGPIGVTGPRGGRRSIIREPSVLFCSPSAVYRLDADKHDNTDVVCASIDFGIGDENPLVRGLPTMLRVPLASMPGLDLTQQLLFGEAFAQRCGHGATVDRLAEVLVIQLLRYAIEQRLVDSGALAGLADPRLAKALNAIHAEPGRAWTLDAMANAAGMSRARFAAHFNKTLGSPPGDYLTGWRLGLARSLLRRGIPVKQVAGEVGYGSANALARAFSRRLGISPKGWQAAVESPSLGSA